MPDAEIGKRIINVFFPWRANKTQNTQTVAHVRAAGGLRGQGLSGVDVVYGSGDRSDVRTKDRAVIGTDNAS